MRYMEKIEMLARRGEAGGGRYVFRTFWWYFGAFHVPLLKACRFL